jgi:cytoplasmic iron level regulating protein YaaA (DUF328/UPF0246 family)
MLTLLSPAKDMSIGPGPAWGRTTVPRLLERSEQLAAVLRDLSTARLAELMGLSPKLAALNQARYTDWNATPSPVASSAAFLAFTGEVYRGLDAPTLSPADLAFAQRHVRMLSGLYGVLRPLDRIMAHRLEMGTPLVWAHGRKGLYDFWGDTITTLLQADLKASGTRTVVDLASTEYFRSVNTDLLGARVVTPLFKEEAGGRLKMVMVYAKRQRGRMCRAIIEGRLLDPEALKEYDRDGYVFRPELSTENEWMFVRRAR